LPTVLDYNPKELVLDGQYTAGDLIYALEHISRNSTTVMVRIDRDVARFLVDTLRRRHAARTVR
jgi:hypothetical protein